MKCANYAGQDCDDYCEGHGCRVKWRSHALDDAAMLLRFRRRAEDSSSWWMYA